MDPVTADIINFEQNHRQAKRVYGLTVRTSTVKEAQALFLSLEAQATAGDSFVREYDVSIDRTSITIWAETPALVDRLIHDTKTRTVFKRIGQYARFKTEPELMEPVMWVDFDASGTDSLSIVELVAELRGEVILQRRLGDDRRRTRVQAPLSELFDLKSRLRGLCEAEVAFEMGFSHYLKI